MTEQKLLQSLSGLGFPMFEPSEVYDVNETLAEVVKSGDRRLWEGFPVMLVSAAEDYQFAPKKVAQQLSGKQQKEQFNKLVLLSLALYAAHQLSFPWANKLKKTFSEKDKDCVRHWKNALVHNKVVQWGDTTFDPERLMGTFQLYFEQAGEKSRRRQEKYEEFSLEYALSQFFSPKQKELFKKKLEGLPLNKTEQEYYSRSVKKKVVALANPELQRLARKLLEK